MAKTSLFLLLLMSSLTLHGDPWGKDADLCQKRCLCSSIPPKCPTTFFGTLAEVLIGFHQDVISPADGPRSHFLPSSSQYTLDAMRKYGFFKGFTMGCDRLMRENDEDWVYPKGVNCAGQLMKLDPVR